MGKRQSEMLRLRDLIEQLRLSQEKLEWSQDPVTAQYLTDTMLRNIDYCKKVCMGLNRRAMVQTVN